MEDKVLFGIYGYPKKFLNSSLGKKRESIFMWLHETNLNAFLIDWTYGIHMGPKKIEQFVFLADKYNIKVLLRAPKDIDLVTSNNKIIKYSIEQLRKAIDISYQLNCKDIVVSLGDSVVTLCDIELESRLFEYLAPLINSNKTLRFHIEPALKKNQYGSLESILSFCKKFTNVFPSINLMKFHALSGCNLIYPDRIMKLFKQVEIALGSEVMSNLVVQICPVSYEYGIVTPKTFGERKSGQLSLFDSNLEYFPKASDYIKTIQKLGINPTTISTTYQTEEVGAMRLRDSYFYHKRK